MRAALAHDHRRQPRRLGLLPPPRVGRGPSPSRLRRDRPPVEAGAGESLHRRRVRVALTEVDAIVIGGGAMGSACAWRLTREGLSVAMLERFEAGHARGSSHGRSRIFRLAYPDPFYVDLA